MGVDERNDMPEPQEPLGPGSRAVGNLGGPT